MSNGALRVGLVYDDTIDRPGGIGLYVLTLGAALQRRGHEVEYLIGSTRATEVDGAPARSLSRNVSVRFNGNALSIPAFSAARTLRGVLDQGRFDVLHVQVPYSPLMAGRLVRRADAGCAVVGTYHVASNRPLVCAGAQVLRLLKLPSAGRFDAMMAVSQTAAQFATRWSGIGIDALVPNGLDMAACAAGEDRREHDLDVVFVGRLVPRKGAGQLIAAVDALRRINGFGRTRLTLIGHGPLRDRLERQVQQLGLSGSVRFLGNLDDAEKLRLLSRAKVACFPSLYGESFGVVVLEALAAGAQAVLAGDNAGYAELLGRDGSITPVRDPDVFARRLAQLLGNESGRVALGDRQRSMLSRFEADVVAGDVLGVYRTALSSRRRPARSERPRTVPVHAPV